MKVKQILFRYRYECLILFMWVLAFALVWPLGEFAVNDDWSYAKNVYHLVLNKSFVVDTWPSMNLISQTVFGSLVCFVFGFSFAKLRIAMFLLAMVSSLYLYRSLNLLSSNKKFPAFIFTAAFCFNSIYLHLSMTYMTDVFFASMLVFSLYAMIRYHQSGRMASYIWFCFWCITAMLCRQHALLFSAMIIPSVLKQQSKAWQKVLLSILPAFLCWQASDAYRHVLATHHIYNGIQQMDRISDYLKGGNPSIHVLQFADQLLVMANLALPMALTLLLMARRRLTKKQLLQLGVCTIMMFLLTFKVCGYYPIGNISDIFEIGPRALKGSRKLFDGQLDLLLRGLAYSISLLSLGVIVFFSMQHYRNKLMQNRTFHPNGIYLLIAFFYLLFIALGKAYFDRYVLPLSLLLTFFLMPGEDYLKQGEKLLLAIVVLFGYGFSVIKNKDYFEWQKCRAKAVVHLQAMGVSDKEMDGGFEFNGWMRKNEPYPTKPELSWWWVTDDKYIISSHRISGTLMDTVFTYQRWIPFRTDSVYVLKH